MLTGPLSGGSISTSSRLLNVLTSATSVRMLPTVGVGVREGTVRLNPLSRPSLIEHKSFGSGLARKSVVDYGVVGGEDGYNLEQLMAWPAGDSFAERSKLNQLIHFVILRGRILFTAIPLAFLVVLIRYLNLSDGLDIPVEGVMLPPTITAAVFVMASVLQNVMQDYKESEKVPAALVAYFSVLVSFARSEAVHHEFDEKPALQQVEDMLLCVLCTLDRKMDFAVALRGFHEAAVAYNVYIKRGSHGHAELEGPEHAMVEILKNWTRIHDIGRLSIILPGYTLMDMLSLILIIELSSVTYSKTSIYSFDPTGYWAVGIFATAIIYINILVRVLDDPFDGPENYQFNHYVTGAPVHMNYLEAYHYGLSIDFACLTIDFGHYLRHLIHDTVPTAGSVARNGVEMVCHEKKAAAVTASSSLTNNNSNISKQDSKMPSGWTYSRDADGIEWYTDEKGVSHWGDSARVQALLASKAVL
jgi:hypothetical protein